MLSFWTRYEEFASCFCLSDLLVQRKGSVISGTQQLPACALIQAVWPSLRLGAELLAVPGLETLAVPHLGLERPLQVGSVALGLQ